MAEARAGKNAYKTIEFRRAQFIHKNQERVEFYLDLLRKAGMPDFAPADPTKLAFKLPDGS